MQKSYLGDVLSELVYSNVSQTAVWGLRHQQLGDFCKFLKKKDILILLNHISHVFKAISKN